MKYIFIISQPRSGSSLLQQIINSNEKVYSDIENWILLSLLTETNTGLSEEGYSTFKKSKNINTFIESNNLKNDYYSAVRKFITDLHSHNLNKGHEYILEKTPRYYHIVNELYSCFPNSKFIFLVRHPLAVLASIINYNFNGKWYNIFSSDRLHDLITCVENINNNNNNRFAIKVKYEDLVNKPKSTLQKIFKFLNLTPNEKIEEYNFCFKGKELGYDKKSLLKHNRPVDNYQNNWKVFFNTPQLKRIGREYIKMLPNDYLFSNGYDLNEINEILKKRWHEVFIPTFSFKFLNKARSKYFHMLITLVYQIEKIIVKLQLKIKSH